MTLTVSQIRAREDAVDSAWLIAFDGIAQMFVTGHTGEGLLGTGWCPSGREVLPGLIMPRSVPKGRLDEKSGMLEGQQVTFTLVDFDGSVASIFAQEGKDYDVLAQDIQPGTSALGVSVAIQGSGTVSPRGRYIGLERIGSAGERVEFSCFPFTRIGPHHAVNVNAQQDEGPPLIRISQSPIDHTGRLVALYQIYRDPFTGTWPSWSDQYSAGGLQWWGKLLDTGEIRPDRKWTVKCAGQESLLRKQLNNNSYSTPFLVAPTVALADAERDMAVWCRRQDDIGNTDYDSAGFGSLTLFASTIDRQSAVSTMNTNLQSVMSGATSTFGGPIAINDTNNTEAQVHSDYIRMRTDDLDDGLFSVHICAHEKVWRTMGYDPPLQHMNTASFPDEKHFLFMKQFGDGGLGGIGNSDGTYFSQAPTTGYWTMVVNTLPYNKEQGWSFVGSWYDNGGNWRYFRPLYFGNMQILSALGGQEIGIDFGKPFIESDPALPFSDATIGGSAVEGSRYFLFKGKITKAIAINGTLVTEGGEEVSGETVESVDIAQVGRLSFRYPAYGEPVEVDSMATGYLERWLDPKTFSMPFAKLDGEWAGVAEGGDNADFGIQCLPLACYGYNDPDTPGNYKIDESSVESAPDVFCQLLLSTGTAGGWSDDYEAGPTFDYGDNSSTRTRTWSADVKRYDLGLAIPKEIVAAPDDIADAFGDTPLNDVRYSYLGPFESEDLLRSLVQPRALALSLRDKRYGLVRLGLFSPADADISIGEADLDDPFGDAVGQQMRAMGQLDRVTLAAGLSPLEAEHGVDLEVRARDANAKDRFGDLKLQLTDDGLSPFRPEGVGDWQQAFRELWSKDRPAFYNARHFKVTGLRVSRIKGQDIEVGTRVLLTNPWIMQSDGTYGVTDAIALVVAVDLDPHEHVYTCELLVFADQHDQRLWGPLGKVVSVTGSTIVLDETAPYASASDFDVKTWSDGTAARVELVTWDGRTWNVNGPYTISSVSGANITITTSPSLAIRDRDIYLIVSDYDGQVVGAWPQDALSVVVLSDWTFGTGPTKGWPLIP